MKFSVITAVSGLAALAQASYINYTTVTGYFLQDEASTDASTFVYYEEDFGLINRTYPGEKESDGCSDLSQWERFYQEVKRLNRESASNVQYKVFFFGRHGEGWHNAAQTYYGTPGWNCYWGEIDGNGTASWNDAALTDNGVAQAQIAHNYWQQLIEEEGIHTPDVYYVSPMTRCLQTANITFNGLDLPKSSAKFEPTIKELFRESISIHTCDNRRSKTYIHDLFPEWKIESGFVEDDELWNGVTAETTASEAVRSKKVLDEVFEEINSKHQKLFVSVTSHSGQIGSMLSVLGHQSFSLSTGAVIPVLIKAETLQETVATTCQTWSTSAHCAAPPATSITDCVCAASATPVTTPLVTVTSEPPSISTTVCY